VNELAGWEPKTVPARAAKGRESRPHEKSEPIKASPGSPRVARGDAAASGKRMENRSRAVPGQDRKPFAPKTESGRRIPKKP